MLVPWKALDGMYRHTSQCNWGADWNICQLAAEEGRDLTSRYFSAYGIPLEMMTSFRYLGRVILTADEEFPVMTKNLSRERAVWRRMRRILSREGGEPRVSGFFLKAVVQAVLLFR